jgi:Flp pilus assembly protein TadG
MLSRRTSCRARPTRSGAATVEFAVVAPVLLFTVFGIFELGRVFMVMELLTEGARRSCRVALIEGTSSAKIKQAATDCLSVVGISNETIGISVNDAPIDSVDPTTMPAGTEITVTVSVPVSKITWMPSPFFTQGTIQGQFTMRRL